MFWGSKSGGNESNVKPSFSNISKAKVCILAKAQASEASSKAKVQASGSKAKVQTSGSKDKVQASRSKAKVQASRFWGSKSGGNESNVKPSFSNISKAKVCILAKAQASEASSKAKVQASGSKAKVQTSGSKDKVQTSGSKAKVQASRSKAKIQALGSKAQASPKTLIVKSPKPITNYVLGLTNAKT
nr:hypothetical protein [Tanacetum cinerariifolium]